MTITREENPSFRAYVLSEATTPPPLIPRVSSLPQWMSPAVRDIIDSDKRHLWPAIPETQIVRSHAAQCVDEMLAVGQEILAFEVIHKPYRPEFTTADAERQNRENPREPLKVHAGPAWAESLAWKVTTPDAQYGTWLEVECIK